MTRGKAIPVYPYDNTYPYADNQSQSVAFEAEPVDPLDGFIDPEQYDEPYDPSWDLGEEVDIGLSWAIKHAVEWQPNPYAREYLRGRLEDLMEQLKVPAYASKPNPRKEIGHTKRRQVMERDQYRCKQCGDWHDLAIDHIHPVSKGGTNDIDNLQVLCRSCNSRKRDRV